jgi:hypothetical protein
MELETFCGWGCNWGTIFGQNTTVFVIRLIVSLRLLIFNFWICVTNIQTFDQKKQKSNIKKIVPMGKMSFF